MVRTLSRFEEGKRFRLSCYARVRGDKRNSRREAARNLAAAGGTFAQRLETGQWRPSAVNLNLEWGEEGAEETAAILIEPSD